MAPWPEQGNEPKAPDKSCCKSGENALLDTSRVSSCASEDADVSATANKNDDKQVEEKNPNVSNLDDGQLKALLDEAITYKCPKDREGKSDLFRELLQEVEADESESRRSGCASSSSGGTGVASSRCYSGNRRRGIPSRRDVTAVSERQTRGGSLQNLVHAASSEFDTTGFGGHGPAGRRRGARQKEQRATSVSARQREGGSLPSNVNVGGDCVPEDSRRRRRDPASAPVEDLAAAATAPARCGGGPGALASLPIICHSSSDSDTTGTVDSVCGAVDGGRPVSTPTVSDRRDTIVAGGTDCEIGTELEVVQRSEVAPRVPNFTSHATLEVGGKSSTGRDSDVDTTVALPLGLLQWSLPVVLQREKGSTSVPVVNGVDQSPLQLASSYNSVKCIMGSVARSSSGAQEERAVSTASAATKGNDAVLKRSVGAEAAKSGVAIHNNYPMQMQHLSVLSLPPNTWIATSLGSEQVGRVFQGSKDFSTDTKAKSLDENGNAVNRLESGQSNERKSKTRRPKPNNESNFIMSHNIEGYRGDKDLDTLIKFIESDTESKGKTKSSSHSNGPINFSNKQQRNNPRKEELVTGTKPRKEQKSINNSAVGVDEDEDKPAKGTRGSKQIPKEHRNGPTVEKGTETKLKKSNSMEEISNRKIEDLTAAPESGSLPSEQASVHRRMKKQTLQEGESSGRNVGGERRSWGLEEHQYPCNDMVASSAEDSSSSHVTSGRKRRGPVNEDRRKPERDATPAPSNATVSGTAEETGFCVFESKKRRKKRRSSSGVRSNPSGVGLFADDGRRSGGGQYNSSQCPSVYQGSRESGYQQKKGFNGGNGFPPHDRTADDGGGSVMLYQYRHRPRSPDHCRRKSTSSVPPSDKSDSSDLDSVHSLPVSSTTARPALDQTSTSSGSTPQASYADIAKMASVNVTTSQGVYANVGFGNSKWPAVSVPKGVVISPPASSSTATPSSNPQFITGPKVNIGAPPVSGSKMGNNPASPNSNCSSANSSHSNASTTVPASSLSGDDTSTASSVNQDTEPVQMEPLTKIANPVADPRMKKDAMTNTTIDFKLVPPYLSDEVELNPKTYTKLPEQPVNILLDSEYPSLEESLVCDKTDRKLGKIPSQQTVSSQSSVSVGNCESQVQRQQANSPAGNPLPTQVPTVVQDIKVLNTVLPPVLQANPLLSQPCPSAQKSLCQDTVPLQESPTPIHHSNPLPEQHGLSAVVQNHEVLPAACVYPSTAPSTIVPPLVKHKPASRKVSSAGSPRPPVIIMNDDDSGTNFGDAGSGELTFGFEVNEQLLLLDGDDASGSDTAQDLSAHLENDSQVSSDELGTLASRISPITEKTGRISSVGDDFSARFREPAVQAGNYDKIVDFVGMAWDDVLKEMSSAQVQSGARVQYYSGQ